MTLESTIEAYFVKRIIELGGFSLKTDRVQGRRFLDRTAFLPGGRVIVAELKRPVGGRKQALQIEYHNQLRLMGHEAYFLKTKEEVDEALRT
jgi:hypothetical protein